MGQKIKALTELCAFALVGCKEKREPNADVFTPVANKTKKHAVALDALTHTLLSEIAIERGQSRSEVARTAIRCLAELRSQMEKRDDGKGRQPMLTDDQLDDIISGLRRLHDTIYPATPNANCVLASVAAILTLRKRLRLHYEDDLRFRESFDEQTEEVERLRKQATDARDHSPAVGKMVAP